DFDGGPPKAAASSGGTASTPPRTAAPNLPGTARSVGSTRTRIIPAANTPPPVASSRACLLPPAREQSAGAGPRLQRRGQGSTQDKAVRAAYRSLAAGPGRRSGAGDPVRPAAGLGL